MKSERVALLWNSDGEVYSLYIYIQPEARSDPSDEEENT